MPGPLIDTKPFAAMRDKLPGPIKALADFVFPLDDPMGGMSPNPMAPVAGLTTRFITGGVPNKALRESHTQRFIEAARGLFNNPQDLAKAERLAQTHPRVAAHTELGPLDALSRMYEGSLGETLIGEAVDIPIKGIDPGRLGKIQVNIDPTPPRGILGGQTPAESLAHELTHVSQSLGNKNFQDLYNLANDAVGYGANPYEISPRVTAQRKMGAPFKPFSATKGAKTIADNAPKALKQGNIREATARQTLGEMIQSRASGTPIDPTIARARAIDSLSALLDK